MSDRTLTSDRTFMDELLDEVEEQENLQSEAFADLTLLEIRDLETKIQNTFQIAEEEQTLIQQWALNRSTKLQERIDLLAKRLETFLRERELKTLDLPNGTIRLRKRQKRVEVNDLDLFLQNATKDMLNTVPEQVKPDLNGIKAHLRMTGGKPIPGVRIIEQDESFSYKLKENGSNGTKPTDEA